MKCPNCGKESEVLISLPPVAHLNVGEIIEWCPRCGATWTHFDMSETVRDLRVPWVSKVDK
jgi:predicted RNA-binding Zn-ribbon protein involved in translation (DUF1610 family)